MTTQRCPCGDIILHDTCDSCGGCLEVPPSQLGGCTCNPTEHYYDPDYGPWYGKDNDAED